MTEHITHTQCCAAARAELVGQDARGRLWRPGPLLRSQPDGLSRRLRRSHPARRGRGSRLSRRGARHARRGKGTLPRGAGARGAEGAAVAADRPRDRRRGADRPSLACGALARGRRWLDLRPRRRPRRPVGEPQRLAGAAGCFGCSSRSSSRRSPPSLPRSCSRSRGSTSALATESATTSMHRRLRRRSRRPTSSALGSLRIDLSAIRPAAKELHVTGEGRCRRAAGRRPRRCSCSGVCAREARRRARAAAGGLGAERGRQDRRGRRLRDRRAGRSGEGRRRPGRLSGELRCCSSAAATTA